MLFIVSYKIFPVRGIPYIFIFNAFAMQFFSFAVINESEAEIVRLIFDRYSNGYTYNDIAKELNAKGYKTKIGREFTSASLNSILNQRKYIGEYVYNRRSSKNINGSYNSHKINPKKK